MTTKDDLKTRQKFFVNNPDKNNYQYTNLNLNQNHKFSNVSTIQSYNKQYNDKYYDSIISDNNERKKKFSTWNNKSITIELDSKVTKWLIPNDKVQKRWKKDGFSNIATNDSTLSLHISAYENSVKAAAVSDSFGAKNTSNKFEQENTKQSFNVTSTFVIQNPFEFPRQRNEKAAEPEVHQFKASQRLLYPNEPSKKGQQDMGERSGDKIKILGKKDTYEYYNKDTIGKGGFANVFKGRRISDKEVVAIKKILKRLDYGSKEVEHMEQLSKDPKNTYTVKLLDYFHDKEELYLILPFYKFGSLRDHIRKNGKLETQTAGKILIQLVNCLSYLHNDKGIMHRDLTSANVIIKEIKDDGRIIVLLSDFGLAKQVGNAAHKNKQTCCGTPGYMPPEVKNGNYRIGDEVYSLGGILYNMLTGREPDVGREKQQLGYVSDGLARGLLDSLWNKEPENRPALQAMKSHPFLNQYVSKVRQSSSRHTSATRECKHRTLDENRKCTRCNEKVARSTKSVKDSRDSAYGSTNKISNRNTDGNSNRGSNRNTDGNTNRGSNRNTDGNTNRGSNRNTDGTRQTSKDPSVRSRKTDNEDAQNDIVWPVPSFEYFAPTSKKQINEYRYITPKGRFVIVDANTFYFEALKNGYVKYIFEVILRDEKQEVKVYVPKNEKQILPQLEDDLIENKKSTGTIRNANRLGEYTSFYMSIVKAINVFYGRNAKINYAYVNGNRKYNAKLMYNDSFRFIFSPNKIFAQERGTSENDFHPAPKGSNAKLTDDETDLFITTRKYLLGLDRLNVEKDGTSFYKPYCMNNKVL